MSEITTSIYLIHEKYTYKDETFFSILEKLEEKYKEHDPISFRDLYKMVGYAGTLKSIFCVEDKNIPGVKNFIKFYVKDVLQYLGEPITAKERLLFIKQVKAVCCKSLVNEGLLSFAYIVKVDRRIAKEYGKSNTIYKEEKEYLINMFLQWCEKGDNYGNEVEKA